MFGQVRGIFFALLLSAGLLLIQSCKVVVEDPNGVRLGDIDSLNWDSLLYSHGTIPGYSSWYIPNYSSWEIPNYSSWEVPNSSSFFYSSSWQMSSSSSSGKETSSSSDEDKICDYFTIKTYTKDTLYSWKQIYADGYEEVVVQADTFSYPGDTPVEFALQNWLVGRSALGSPIVTTELVCDNQDEYYAADSTNTISRLSASKDTVFLNYTGEAIDSLVEPSIQIANKAEIKSLLDTLVAGTNYYQKFTLVHFKGDSLRIRALGPSWITSELTVSNPYPSISISPPADIVDTTKVSWQIRIRNRFGFRDNFIMESVIIPMESLPLPITQRIE